MFIFQIQFLYHFIYSVRPLFFSSDAFAQSITDAALNYPREMHSKGHRCVFGLPKTKRNEKNHRKYGNGFNFAPTQQTRIRTFNFEFKGRVSRRAHFSSTKQWTRDNGLDYGLYAERAIARDDAISTNAVALHVRGVFFVCSGGMLCNGSGVGLCVCSNACRVLPSMIFRSFCNY